MNTPAVLSGFLAIVACGPLLATPYSIIEIPQLTHAAGLNDNGDVVGDNLFYHHSSGVVIRFSDAFSLAGINDHGQIIGTAFLGSPTAPIGIQASVWLMSGGQELLGDGGLSEAVAINNAGRAVGSSGDFHAQSHAELWRLKDNTETSLGTLVTNNPHGFIFDPGSAANAINIEGDVVGWSDALLFDAQGNPIEAATHAFRWRNGVMTDLGTLGGSTFSVANGINDTGEIVGVSDIANGASHAFLDRRNRMVDLGDLANDPKLNSQADGVNDRGQIVGWSEVRLTADHSVAQRAFVYSSGKMLNLTFQIETRSPLFLKVRLTEATAINCKGWITADGFDAATLHDHAYLLIPRGSERDHCEH
jgi:probable HAF family extracellular repeat protein